MNKSKKLPEKIKNIYSLFIGGDYPMMASSNAEGEIYYLFEIINDLRRNTNKIGQFVFEINDKLNEIIDYLQAQTKPEER